MSKINCVLPNRESFNQEKSQVNIICLLVSDSLFVTLTILKDNILY